MTSIPNTDRVVLSEWLRTTVAMVVEQGHRVTPVYANRKAAPFAAGQTYANTSATEWDQAAWVGVVLDRCVLIDIDGNKAQSMPDLEAVAMQLGMDELPQVVQQNRDGTSLHCLCRLPDGFSPAKQSADGALPYVDIKTGNQLMHLKPGKIITDDCLPRPEELPIAPPELLAYLSGNVIGFTAADHHDPADGVTEGSRNSTLASLVGRWINEGLSVDELIAKALDWNQQCKPPLPEREVRATVASMAQTHLKNPKNQPKQTAPIEGFDFANFSLRGHSAQMEQQMLDDKFILGRIALLGQSTAIYAKPNAGKTLLTLWELRRATESGELAGDDVFYVNADDNHKGLTQKLRLAEQAGFHMLAPGYNGFKAAELARYLASVIASGNASRKVLILDTVKKFTDLMDKKKGSDFGTAVRQFVSHGGSVIMLAHVNKHRDADGKVVFAGTSDLVDDADCAYTLDVIEDDLATRIRTVRFDNFKSRGDVADQVTYRYDATKGLGYFDRLNSVEVVSDEETRRIEAVAKGRALLAKNQAAVESITACIMDGITLKSGLITAVAERTGLGQKKIRAALHDHTGTDFELSHRWTVEVRENNAHHYIAHPVLQSAAAIWTPPLKLAKPAQPENYQTGKTAK